MQTKELIKTEDKPILNEKVVVIKRIMSKSTFGDDDKKNADIIVGSDEYERKSNTYTILKNHNEDLVAKIKELAQTPFDGYVDCGFKGSGKIESELDGQFVCIGEDGKRFFADKDEIEHSKKEHILNLINKTYPVGKYFNENFGSLFGDSIITVHSNPFEHEWSQNKEYQYDDLMSACYQDKKLSFHEYMGEIEIGEHSNGYSTMFCHFNEDGQYVNRDYNLNIVYLSKQTTPTLKEALAKFSSLIPEGGYMRKDDRWYGETAAFIVSPMIDEDEKPHGLRFARYNFSGKNTYVSPRHRSSKIKMPKSAQESSKEELLGTIEVALREYGFRDSY